MRSATVYSIYLDRMVTRQFEGRRWTLPAQVYAAPLELYAGPGTARRSIEQELQRLQYRSIAEPSARARIGARQTRLDVALRAARFADETRPSQRPHDQHGCPTASPACATAVARTVPIVRLEPLLIGSIFPDSR